VGKPDTVAIAAAKADIASVISRVVEVAHAAVADLTADDIKRGFGLPQKDAPAWTGLVTRIASAAARSETESPTNVHNNLQLVMIGKAESTESWLEKVEALNAKKKLKAIDVPVLEEAKK
jgi:hypothetical protein